jgi:hypothetical protein
MGNHRNFKDEFNRSFPLFSASKFGQYLEDLVTKLNALGAAVNSSVLSSPGLVIKAGSSTLAKAGSAFAAIAGRRRGDQDGEHRHGRAGGHAGDRQERGLGVLHRLGRRADLQRQDGRLGQRGRGARAPAGAAGRQGDGGLHHRRPTPPAPTSSAEPRRSMRPASPPPTYNSVGPTPFGGVSAHTLLSAL